MTLRIIPIKMVLLRNIFKLLPLMGLCLTLSSCIYEKGSLLGCEPAETPGGIPGDPFTISFKIKPIASHTRSDAEPKEMISYLRIIILNDGKVESNRLIQLNDITVSADLEYEYRFETTPGQKSFYLIGNEQSVGDITFATPTSELPAGLKNYISDFNGGFTLSDLLEYYMKGETGSYPDSTNAGEFEQVINSIYFNPDYSTGTDGNLYLPYTAYYGGEGFNLTADTELDNMYLVPAAAKFTFVFNNYREDNVLINGIKISGFNNEVTFEEVENEYTSADGTTYSLGAICDSSYVFGQVDGSETRKSFNGQNLYWIDWMQRVAEETQNNLADNFDINQKYGWIEKYTIPDSNDLPNVSNVVEYYQPGAKTWLVYGTALNNDEPYSLRVGPYYVPESRNIVEFTHEYIDPTTNKPVTETVTRQAYYLSLDMNQEGKDVKPDFTVVEIDNLQSLFRGTSVIITVNMRKGNYGIYAEIAPWTNNRSYGYVTERPDDD